MYGDDIILMSTTLSGLQRLVDTCIEVSRNNCINFNSDKTEFCISKGIYTPTNLIRMNGYTIRSQNTLKHLGFLWNNKNNTLSMEDDNIKSRVNKYWAVIKTLINGGIRFCHPQTIKHLFLSLAIPTLSYGIELCNLTDNLLNKLNVEARKGLKALFNISTHSRNYLNTLLNIDHLSTIIIRNKLKFLTRLLNNKKTANIILRMLENIKYPNFITDIHNITSKLGIDFIRMIISRTCPAIQTTFENIDEAIHQELIGCLNMWNLQEYRTRFTNILEERVWN